MNALARACSLDPTLSPLLMPHLQRYNDRAAQLRQQQAGERQRGVCPVSATPTSPYVPALPSPPLPSPSSPYAPPLPFLALNRQRSTEEVFDKVCSLGGCPVLQQCLFQAAANTSGAVLRVKGRIL